MVEVITNIMFQHFLSDYSRVPLAVADYVEPCVSRSLMLPKKKPVLKRVTGKRCVNKAAVRAVKIKLESRRACEFCHSVYRYPCFKQSLPVQPNPKLG